MTALPDLPAGINLLLCTVIFLPGYLVYRKQEKVSALLIGIAFGMFGLQHFSVLTGIAFPEVTFIQLKDMRVYPCRRSALAGAFRIGMHQK